MKQYSHIGFIGAGNLGGALGKNLQKAGYSVLYWDVDKTLATAKSLDDLAQSCDLILICTPSQVNRLIARDIAQAVGNAPTPTVISLAKGIEPGFITMDQVLAAELGRHYISGVVSGPMLASEITTGGISGAIVATTEAEATAGVAHILVQAGVITSASSDATGVARCGALKNVYALILGMADGLKLSFNAKSVLTTLVIAEFRQVLATLGSSPELTYSLAGLGDLLTTGWSGSSYNWSIGKQRGEGQPAGKGEGYNTLMQLPEVLPIAEFPLIYAAHAIFSNQAGPETLVEIIKKHNG
ncbi:MAG TPA: NAD(P)-binding domain-containing protein [Candidatus Saccharimonadia bacterium]